MGLHTVYFVSILLFSMVSLYHALCEDGWYCKAGYDCASDNSSCIEGTCDADQAAMNGTCDPVREGTELAS